MTDDEWEKRRDRAIAAAFQTGRPVFADNEGELRYVDGAKESLADDAGMPKTPLPPAVVKIHLWTRVKRWLAGRS